MSENGGNFLGWGVKAAVIGILTLGRRLGALSDLDIWIH